MRCVALVILAACMPAMSVCAGSLQEAPRTGKSQQMAQILELRADVNQRGRQDETALHWMAFHGNEAMVRKLITTGADVNARTSNGSTPLHLAAYKGHINVASLLVAGNGGVNTRTRDGITPLDWALRNGNREVAEFLISHGARTGSSPAGTATTLSRSVKKLEDLRHFNRLKPILARQLPQIERRPALAEPQASKVLDPESHPKTGAFRIQLATLATHDRVQEAWNMFSRRYPDILDGRDLFVEPVHVNGNTLYRVQAGTFTKRAATLVCNQLTGRRQPCLVISADPLRLAEQGKAKLP